MRLRLFALIAGMLAQHNVVAEQSVWRIDSTQSNAQVGISLRIPVYPEGKFKDISGELSVMSERQMSVHLLLNTQELQMSGPSWVQKYTISKPFLDVATYPHIEFQSHAFPSQKLITGGQITGLLTIKGQKREVIFEVSPTTCHRPGYSCTIIGKGAINRQDFGINANRWTVRDQVRFSFQLKFKENE